MEKKNIIEQIFIKMAETKRNNLVFFVLHGLTRRQDPLIEKKIKANLFAQHIRAAPLCTQGAAFFIEIYNPEA